MRHRPPPPPTPPSEGLRDGGEKAQQRSSTSERTWRPALATLAALIVALLAIFVLAARRREEPLTPSQRVTTAFAALTGPSSQRLTEGDVAKACLALTDELGGVAITVPPPTPHNHTIPSDGAAAIARELTAPRGPVSVLACGALAVALLPDAGPALLDAGLVEGALASMTHYSADTHVVNQLTHLLLRTLSVDVLRRGAAQRVSATSNGLAALLDATRTHGGDGATVSNAVKCLEIVMVTHAFDQPSVLRQLQKSRAAQVFALLRVYSKDASLLPALLHIAGVLVESSATSKRVAAAAVATNEVGALMETAMAIQAGRAPGLGDPAVSWPLYGLLWMLVKGDPACLELMLAFETAHATQFLVDAARVYPGARPTPFVCALLALSAQPEGQVRDRGGGGGLSVNTILASVRAAYADADPDDGLAAQKIVLTACGRDAGTGNAGQFRWLMPGVQQQQQQ